MQIEYAMEDLETTKVSYTIVECKDYATGFAAIVRAKPEGFGLLHVRTL